MRKSNTKHNICIYIPPNHTKFINRLNKRHITYNTLSYSEIQILLERKKEKRNSKSKFTNKTIYCAFSYQQTI